MQVKFQNVEVDGQPSDHLTVIFDDAAKAGRGGEAMAEVGSLTSTGANTIAPTSNVVALTVQAGGSSDPLRLLAVDGSRLIQFQNIAAAPKKSAGILFSGSNGGGSNGNAWAVAIDVSAGANDSDPLRFRDFVICKVLGNDTVSDPEGLYGSYGGPTTATPSGWAFGLAQPTTDYRLHVLPGSGDLTQGALAIHTNISQTGKPFTVYTGVNTSSGLAFYVGPAFDLMHRASPSNRTVADGVTNSTTTVTSATAAFTSDDLGRYITATGIPSGSYITAVTNATTVTISQTATASASGLALTVVVPQTNFQTNGNAPYFQINPGTGGVGGALASVCRGFSLGPGAPAIPLATLDMGELSTNNVTLRMRTASQGGFQIIASGSAADVTLYTTNASTLELGTNATQAIKITTLQSVLLGKTGAAAADTDGYGYMQSIAGAPSGVPTSQTGFNAFRYDTTNHKLWIYDAGWKGVVVA